MTLTLDAAQAEADQVAALPDPLRDAAAKLGGWHPAGRGLVSRDAGDGRTAYVHQSRSSCSVIVLGPRPGRAVLNHQAAASPDAALDLADTLITEAR